MIADIDAAPYGVLIAISVQDSSNAATFDDDDVAFMEDLGAGGPGCPVRLGKPIFSVSCCTSHLSQILMKPFIKPYSKRQF